MHLITSLTHVSIYRRWRSPNTTEIWHPRRCALIQQTSIGSETAGFVKQCPKCPEVQNRSKTIGNPIRFEMYKTIGNQNNRFCIVQNNRKSYTLWAVLSRFQNGQFCPEMFEMFRITNNMSKTIGNRTESVPKIVLRRFQNGQFCPEMFNMFRITKNMSKTIGNRICFGKRRIGLKTVDFVIMP